MTRHLAKSILQYLPGVLVPLLTGAVAAAVYTRLFSPATYGTFILLQGGALVAASFGGQWLQQSILRYEYHDARQVGSGYWGILSCFCIASAAAAFAVVVVEIVFLASYRVQSTSTAVLVIAVCVLEVILQSALSALRAEHQAPWYSRLMIAQGIMKVVLPLAAAALLRASASSLLVGLVLAQGATLTLSIKAMRASIPAFVLRRPTVSRAILLRYGRFGIPMGFWFAAGQVMAFTDRYVITNVLGTAAAGVYTPSYNLGIQVCSLASIPVMMALHPALASEYGDSKSERCAAARLLEDGLGMYLLIGGVMVVAGTVLSAPIVELLLGHNYQAGLTVLPAAIISSYIWNLSLYLHKPLELQGRTIIMAALLASSAVLGLGVTLPLVRQYGILGAALGYGVSVTAYAIAVAVAVRVATGWRLPLARIGKALVAVAVGLGIAWSVTGGPSGSTPTPTVATAAAAAGSAGFLALAMITRVARVADVKRWLSGGSR